MRPIDADRLKVVLEKNFGHTGGASVLEQLIDEQPTIQPVATDTNVGDKISKFIDGLEETFAYVREREGSDSVCGLCEYDGAYIGESGDWCNECPGFGKDDCFKLSTEIRKKWKAQLSEEGTTKDTTSDTISRQTAINALMEKFKRVPTTAIIAKDVIENLPSAQPEITRCRDCKYRDEKWRRTSVRWLPCMDVRTGGNWYCGSAERGEQDE